MAVGGVADTGVLVGALNPRDISHVPAREILTTAESGRLAPLVVTDFVLAETLNFITRKLGSPHGRESLRRIESSVGLELVRISDGVFSSAKNDVYRFVDGLSFVDAITVAYMREKGIKRLYSFDSGFDVVRGIRRIARL